MQLLKLTTDQRSTIGWQRRRNHLVCQLRAKDKFLLPEQALKIANRMMSKALPANKLKKRKKR